jgi:phage-related protein
MRRARLHVDCEAELATLKGRNTPLLSRVIHDIELLRQFGPGLMEGRIKDVTDEVSDLQTRLGPDTHHLLFTMRRDAVLGLASFTKSDKRIPRGKIDLARDRLKELHKSGR